MIPIPSLWTASVETMWKRNGLYQSLTKLKIWEQNTFCHCLSHQVLIIHYSSNRKLTQFIRRIAKKKKDNNNKIQKTQFSWREKKFIRKALLYLKDPKNRSAVEPQECPKSETQWSPGFSSVMFFPSVCPPFLFLTLPFSFPLFFLFSRS